MSSKKDSSVQSDNSGTQKLIGSPKVLVVDDEELMREVVTIMIEENGGTVLTAIDGLDALEVFTENVSSIDCVILDFSMPRMNGYESFVEIRKVKPDIKVIMVSGLKVTAQVQDLVKAGDLTFLSKPFHEADLISALNSPVKG